MTFKDMEADEGLKNTQQKTPNLSNVTRLKNKKIDFGLLKIDVEKNIANRAQNLV